MFLDAVPSLPGRDARPDVRCEHCGRDLSAPTTGRNHRVAMTSERIGSAEQVTPLRYCDERCLLAWLRERFG